LWNKFSFPDARLYCGIGFVYVRDEWRCIMQVVILAAGYATRLYPLTENTPKPLLPVAGRPMLNYIMDRVEEMDGVKEVLVVTNSRFFQEFVDWGGGYRGRLRIRILDDGTSSNDDRLGAVGDIHFAVEQAPVEGDLLVIAGDNLFEFSLGNLVLLFRRRQAPVVGICDLKDPAILAGKYGVVEMDDQGRISGFWEKPENPRTTLASTGVYAFRRQDLDILHQCIIQHRKPDNLGDFVRYLADREDVYGFVFQEAWFDIGSPEQFEEVNRLYVGRAISADPA